MFASRLDAARRSVEQERRIVSPAKAGERHVAVDRDRKVVYHNSDNGSSHVGYSVDGKDGLELNRMSIEVSNASMQDTRPAIMFKLSEYLFDLFDANCMADFHRMEKFELTALRSFEESSPHSEFTHEQHRLHEQFLELFEELIEGFLRQENYSVEEFYQQLALYLDLDHRTRVQDSGCFDDGSSDLQPSEPDSANDVLEVIRNYMRFDMWADNMRQMARQQLRFQSFREQMEIAVQSDYEPPAKYSPTNHSIAHRLTEK